MPHDARRLSSRLSRRRALGGVGAAALSLGQVPGAVAQEAIDVVAVLNALRTARVPRSLTDFEAA